MYSNSEILLEDTVDQVKVKEGFNAIEENFFIKILGSYPREY